MHIDPTAGRTVAGCTTGTGPARPTDRRPVAAGQATGDAEFAPSTGFRRLLEVVRGLPAVRPEVVAAVRLSAADLGAAADETARAILDLARGER
jgi:hypothetical protein